jgi:hypothetical protein
MGMCIKIFLQYWLATLLVLTGSAVHADIFKWIDGSGQTHYGDKPPTGTSGIEVIETFECGTQACIEEQERRWQDAMEVNERMQEWLQQRATERTRAQEQRNLVTVSVYTYQPPQWSFAHYPVSVSRPHFLPRHPHPARPSRPARINRPPGRTRNTSHRYLARPRPGTSGWVVHR